MTRLQAKPKDDNDYQTDEETTVDEEDDSLGNPETRADMEKVRAAKNTTPV
jgi:hypothetical protein